MQYDPIKDRLARFIGIFPWARKLFYVTLDLLLLRQRYVKKALRRHSPVSGNWRFYDAGAGFCQYSWYMLKTFQNCTVFANDLKTDYLSGFALYARIAFPGRFFWQQADLQDFIPKNIYQIITAIDILEHIPNDVAVLRNFHACLNPGGKLIISTPSDTDEAAKFTEEHVRPGYNKDELEEKLKQAGFGIVESIYSYGKWGALAWRLQMKHPLSLLLKSRFFGLLLPFYYLLVLPLAEVLMRLDLAVNNKQGTGIIIVAEKPA